MSWEVWDMNSKSLVNGSIIKSDLRRYWYLCALFAVMLLLTTALPARDLYVAGNNIDTIFETSRFANTVFMSIVPITMFSIIIPALIFSYMHHKSAVNAMHCIPVKREGLYFSHLISIAILIAAAIAVNTLVMLTTCDVPSSFVIIWALLSLVYCFVISMFSAMASMLVGNTAAGIVLPAIVLALPAFIETMFDFVCARYLYGYVSNHMVISEFIYLGYRRMLDGWFLMYIGMGIVFFLLGLLIYKKRALENNSRILAFDFVNPIFMYSFSLCLGFLGYAYMDEMISVQTMWIALPFGIAGIIIARMIIGKTFKPKGVIAPIAVYCLMMCVVYLFVGFDITGYEKRVPLSDNVESVAVIGYSYRSDVQTEFIDDGSEVRITDEAIYDPTIRDAADIAKVTALHNAIVSAGKSERTNQYIPITYTLKNGKTLCREYSFDNIGDMNRLYGDVMDIEAVKADYFPVISKTEKEHHFASVSTMGSKYENLTDEQIGQITEALKQDILNASYDVYKRRAGLTRINLGYRMPTVYKDGTPVADKNKWISNSAEYIVYPAYENTAALLKKWNLYHKIPTAADVSKITVHDILEEEERGNIYERSIYKNATAIEDSVQIQKIIDYLKENEDKLCVEYGDGAVQRVEMEFKNGNVWVTSLTEALPE